MKNAIKTAISIAGSQSELARRCRVGQPTVSKWLNRSKRVPAEFVLPIERATGGKVSRYDLRPDIYPNEKSA